MLLNEYQIESSQTGYFSRILKVKKLETQDYFIIKMMEKNNNKYSKELKNEIAIIKDINHPNIVKLIDIKEDDKYFYFINEYCNGGSIIDYFHEFIPLSEEIIQHVIKQIIEAVKYLHNKKIVNRDIMTKHFLLNYETKEDLINKNILKAKIKLNGFSLSKHFQKGILINELRGHVRYTAPEVLKCPYNEKVDIWSLGIICSELLNGNNTYNVRNFENGNNINFFLPMNISKEILTFINCMLQYDPNLRKSADQLCRHEFLKKDMKNFHPINFSDIKDHVQDSKIVINFKDNQWISNLFGWGIIDNI